MRTLAELIPHLKLGGRRPPLPPLALLTDHTRLADPLAAAAALPAGSLVVFRHYDMPGRAALAAHLARLCRARRLVLLVAADLDLAVRLGAGVHLPEGLAVAASPRLRLWHRRRGRCLTAAAHGRLALCRAAGLGADAALLSPVFPTASHPGAKSLGPLAFRRLARGAALPVYALGGVTGRTIGRLAASGAAGVATVGGLNR